MIKSLHGVMMVVAFLAMTVLDVPARAQSEYVPDGYNLVWSDEFDGNSLDMSKWDYRRLGRRNNAYNVKNAVSLGEDGLQLTTSRYGNKYYTGMIGTQGKFETTYGYFECQVKLQTQVGHWSAFWLQSPDIGDQIGDPGNSGTEIDIYEYLVREGDNVHNTLHWDGYKHGVEKSRGTLANVPGLSDGDWHTFGLLWTPDEYIYYVDGKETWRCSQGISHRPEYIILSLEVGPWAGHISQAQLPDSLFVKYVRVYQKPAE